MRSPVYQARITVYFFCKPQVVAEVLSREIGSYTFFFGPLMSVVSCKITRGKMKNDQIGHCGGRCVGPKLEWKKDSEYVEVAIEQI